MSTASDGRNKARRDDASHEIRKDEYQEFVGIIGHLEDSLSFIPASKGGPIEGRIMTIIQSLIQKEDEAKQKEDEMTQKNDEIKRLKSELYLHKKGGDTIQPSSLLMSPSLDEGDNKNVVKLQAELEMTKSDLSEMEKALQARDQEVVNLTKERDIARTNAEEAKANMEDAQSKANDLDKDVARAHKVKASALDARNKLEVDYKKLEADYKALEVRVNSRDGDHKLDRIEVARLKKELESQKKSYERIKTLSLLDDVKKIKALNLKVDEAKERIVSLELDVREKEALLEANRSKVQRADDEKNEVLQRLGHLQEELGKKDLELSGVRLKAGGLESTAKLVEKEREAESRKAKQELEMVQHELVIARKRISEREKDIEFWRASIANQEKKADEQAVQIQNDSKTIKDLNTALDTLRSNHAKLQGEVDTMQMTIRSHESNIQEQEQTIKEQKDMLDDIRKRVSESEAEAVDLAQLQEIMETLRYKVQALTIDSTETQSLAKTDTPEFVAAAVKNQPSLSSSSSIWSELVGVAKGLATAVGTIQEARTSFLRGKDGDQKDSVKVAEMESKLQEQAVAHQRSKQEWDHSQEQLCKEVETLLEQLRGHEEKLQELDGIKAMFDSGPEGTERQLEYLRACAGIDALGEMVADWEAAMEKANKTRDYMLVLCEEQAQQIQRYQSQKTDLEDKIARVERDLERCRGDLESTTADLVQCRVDTKEKDTRAEELEMELLSSKHELNRLHQSFADQGQQLDGRERAYEGLERARKTYNKVYESKIKRLQEDKSTLETIFNAELLKRDEAHLRELNKAMGDWDEGLGLSRDEILAIKAECENLKATLDVAELDKAKMNSMLETYSGLVTILQNEGKFSDDTLALVDIYNQVQEYQGTIDTLRSDLKILSESNEGLNQLVKEYQEDTTTLTNRTESYLGQIKQLEDQVLKLRQELAQNENTVRLLHSRTLLLERDLKEQTEPKLNGTTAASLS
ncbi:hypothetical protein BGZ95_000201 [Linnemannia exigua]|uniref:Uncharacterized protein n=1 Tax=Linnemannia exigua TaxID=604196 RepID=A0AAD4H916_9FUNG|nr:hypothetical protein BGZ95_000201 [Linnemannia exigua]